MKHALVVGGSGMLAKASLWLADQDYRVTVIGRNKDKLRKLSNKNVNIVPMSVDYYNKGALTSNIRKSITAHGAYDLVVAWIHSNDKTIIESISNEITMVTENQWSLFHVLASREDAVMKRVEMNDLRHCDYHQVQLGFIIESNKCSRWLTNDEICKGVIGAIESDSKHVLVGTLTPSTKRPNNS